MRLAVVAAGFTPGEADQLRRAMAAWRRPGVIEQFRAEAARRACRRTVCPRNSPSACISRSRASASTAFPESHAASFALLGVCLGVAQALLPGRVRRRDDQQPADGVLRAGATRARCAGSRRRGAAGGCESRAAGIARWSRGQGAGAGSRAKARARGRPRPRVLRLGLCMLNGLREAFGELIERVRATRPLHVDRRLRPPHRLGPGGDQAARRGRCVWLARHEPPAGAVASARAGKEAASHAAV